ncbi:glycosyltransferase [Rhizobium sp. L1K21]|uniref:glycosyltransferase n=1 Tax=Rhizobium sp. L1K21 TaxID=2954933 RepID=UPI002093E472|nr:glycosyltransferase [Rhizobium sp. L1K21]MCO6186062.1 glycosyltransferase [Rhizobium sp. L1K21]
MDQPDIAIILPCYNEGRSIRKVVSDFKAALPDARVYVFDNNSKDDTRAEAEAAGAIVRSVRAQGKGNVLRQAFSLLDADIYVMADGDGTYDAAAAPDLVRELIENDMDMVVGVRRHEQSNAYRSGHVLGNRLFNWFVGNLFETKLSDIFSGYRVLSRPFVKSLPALAEGFETETEMTLHAIELRLPVSEVETRYGARAEGDTSKLNTYRDGLRILLYLFRVMKQIRPFYLFNVIAGFFVAISLGLGVPVIIEFLITDQVARFPTAIAASGVMIIGFISFMTGILLDNVAHAHREQKRLAYLSVQRTKPLVSKPVVSD